MRSIEKIADRNGDMVVDYKLCEELSELITEIMRARVAMQTVKPSEYKEARLNAISKIADVYIMLEQYQYLQEISTERLDEEIEHKIQRTLSRLGLED